MVLRLRCPNSALTTVMQSVPPAFAAATRRVAGVGELGDGQVYRLCRDLQRELFDPPELDGRMPRVSKWER